MKRLLTMATAALLAFPLLAAEKEQAKPLDSQPKAGADSPMVAAAKRTNRTAKKSIVITNDDLKNAKGHITTTTVVRQVYVPEPTPTPEMVAAQNAAKARAIAAEKAAKAEVVKKARQAQQERAYAAAAEGDDPYSDMDPAQAEQETQKAASDKKP